MTSKGTQHQKPKSLEKKCWGFYKEPTHMIFNCTSFYIFNDKFYSFICHFLRTLCVTVIIFYDLCMTAIMNERALKIHGIVYSYR
jgi:hypothetical protein